MRSPSSKGGSQRATFIQTSYGRATGAVSDGRGDATSVDASESVEVEQQLIVVVVGEKPGWPLLLRSEYAHPNAKSGILSVLANPISLTLIPPRNLYKEHYPERLNSLDPCLTLQSQRAVEGPWIIPRKLSRKIFWILPFLAVRFTRVLAVLPTKMRPSNLPVLAVFPTNIEKYL